MDLPCGLPALIILAVVLGGDKGEARARGKLIGSLRSNSNGISGELYAMNNQTLLLLDFSYDGQAPNAQFYVGDRRLVGNNPSFGGTLVPYENDGNNRLESYINRNILLNLPGLRTVDILWFSIWCSACQSSDLASVSIPPSFSVPDRIWLGRFFPAVDGVRSGNVYLLDTKTIFIKNFTYNAPPDGLRFIVGRYPIGGPGYELVESEPGNRRYVEEDLEILIPGSLMSWSIEYLSLYSLFEDQNYGHISIPSGLTVPESLDADIDSSQTGPTPVPTPFPTAQPTPVPQTPAPSTILPPSTNCEVLVPRRFELAWSTDRFYVYLTFLGVLNSNEYMAFGLSGAVDRTVMIDGDVLAAWYADNGPVVTDYRLQSRLPCNGNAFGACPDSQFVDPSRPEPADSGLIETSGSVINGITRIDIKRPFNTGDTLRDRVFNPFADLHYLWAIGTYDQSNIIRKHTIRVSPSDPLIIQLGRNPVNNNCQLIRGRIPTTTTTTLPPPPIWAEQRVRGVDRFQMEVGPSGGRSGYQAITGQEEVDLVYYVNNLLIPVLEVERGKTYTFVSSTGLPSSGPTRYYPYYITTDREGGYDRQTSAQRQRHAYYLGIEPDGSPSPGTGGPLCEYLLETRQQPENFNTFGEFFSVLVLQCNGGNPGVLNWTVPMDAPDILYYQSYFHLRRGWRIEVTGERARVTPASTAASSNTSTTTQRSTSVSTSRSVTPTPTPSADGPTIEANPTRRRQRRTTKEPERTRFQRTPPNPTAVQAISAAPRADISKHFISLCVASASIFHFASSLLGNMF